MSIWTDDQGRLHVGVMVKGKRIHRRLPSGASKSDAKQLEADLRKAAGRPTVAIPDDPPLELVMALYLDHAETLRSADTARFHALRAGPWCAGKRASEARDVADKMVEDMRGHYAAATINRTIGTLKAALKIAFRRRLTTVNFGADIRRMPENNARHVYLSIDEVRQLADNASEQTRAAIWIALLTGCRRGEILKLRPEHIGRDSLMIPAGNTKTLRTRTIPIVPALRPWLEFIPLQINHEGLKSGFRRAREAAGLAVNFHDLRHSCASLLINFGVPLEVIRDILGHTTVKTTERYAHLVIDRQAEALAMLSKAVGAGANRV